jgi:hypothetical protein
MTDIPGATAEARVMQGSIEVLVVISVVLGLLRSYNEFYATVETATANTRRIVERLADAYLAQPASPTVPVQPGWHAATTAHWWLAPAALAAAREPTAAAAGPISRVPRLPAIDARAVVLWALGVVTFLTVLYVAASILLEVFAD